MSHDEAEPLLDVAQGDPALSQHLRNSLRLLRDRADDAEFRQLADDILAGRRGLREAIASPALARVLDPRVDEFAERYDQLSAQERAELAAEGERQFGDLREQLAEQQRRRDSGGH
ncbi:hypothetical protein [Krasilnikovia sp. M28-CT-15]|uniref:hypothetical protein n=1 Tax=Krasilnikovia sp. M28-CT-15 TaxID=3373540 RepID=UPI003877700F